MACLPGWTEQLTLAYVQAEAVLKKEMVFPFAINQAIWIVQLALPDRKVILRAIDQERFDARRILPPPCSLDVANHRVTMSSDLSRLVLHPKRQRHVRQVF